ncbi:MAG: Hint domain-containing protein [Rhodospirillales bacterium]|nr:Hint domain-containing protein [Rhodospirillales bacterium]
MSGSITGQHSTSVSLVSGSYADPVTNLGTIDMTAPGPALYAASNWSIVNRGTVIGENTLGSSGILLASGGSVINGTSGLIEGYVGVTLAAGGYVSNASTGTIDGDGAGILGVTAASTVINSGTILATGTSQSGATGIVLAGGGGFVSNAASGIIRGGAGVYGAASSGALGLVNDGQIVGTQADGVQFGVLAGSVFVSNASGAGIYAGKVGVLGGGVPLTVLNAGSIISKSFIGVELSDGGSVTNEAGGTIAGAFGGAIDGGSSRSATVINGGQILSGYTGIYLVGGGYVSNASTGTILAALDAINAPGSLGGGGLRATTVINAGTIEGTNGSGIEMYVGGFVSNAAHALIGGGTAGVTAATLAVTIVNAGVISAYNAVELSAGGALTNAAGGILTGPGNGFEGGSSAAATVLNAGTIEGTSGVGVYLRGGGYLSNAFGGSIIGGFGVSEGTYGVNVAAFTMINAGTISGLRGYGIRSGGGFMSNASSGLITSSSEGIQGAATVINAGTIAGPTYAIGLAANLPGDSVSNASGASIIGGIERGSASVVNAGYITGQIGLYDGSVLRNEATGTIVGSHVGFDGGTTAASTLLNAGTIADPSGGVLFATASISASGSISYLSNASTATIVGYINAYSPVSVVNAGQIAGGGSGGISLRGGGFLTNEATGTIRATAAFAPGLYGGSTGALTVFNAGTIEDTNTYLASYAAELAGGGIVTNAAGAVLASYGTALDATGVAATVINDGLISSGAKSAVALALKAGGLLVNQAQGTIASAYFGGGAAMVEDAGTLGAVSLASGYNDTITVETGGTFYGLSGQFTIGQTIELAGTSETYGSLRGGVLTLSGGTTLHLAGSFMPGVIQVADAGGNTFITACFATGTGITTSRGRVAVEALRVGDLVLTAAGRLAPVRWLGHRRTSLSRHPHPHDVMPVRVRAGAFGNGLPCRDLVLSPDHAVLVDGSLVPVRHLVNGQSITQERREAITYWHVELDRHDVILAESLPCETYLDTGNRGAFDNAAGAVALHPDFSPQDVARRVWHERGCAPILVDPAEPALRAIHTRLLAAARRHRPARLFAG